MDGFEYVVTTSASWLRLGIEALGTLIIGAGIVVTLYHAALTRVSAARNVYREARLTLSHFLVLALEFQLAADIVSTAVTPTWNQLGQLATVAVIRTFLNYFLQREIDELERSAQSPSPS